MGVKFPLLITLPIGRFPHAEFVAAMGGINFLYVPLNIRESGENHRRIKLENLNLFPLSQKNDGRLLKQLEAIQTSFTVTRDIGESDPIRMAPPRVAEYVKQFFEGTAIKVHVESDPEIIKREYPLMAAVNRCANVVESHQVMLSFSLLGKTYEFCESTPQLDRMIRKTDYQNMHICDFRFILG